MHDAAEAFIGDIPKPLKQLLPDYQAIEAATERAVAQRFSLSHPMPQVVKDIDIRMLGAEQLQVMDNLDEWHFTYGLEPADVTIRFWSPDEAARRFLDRYFHLFCNRAEQAGERP